MTRDAIKSILSINGHDQCDSCFRSINRTVRLSVFFSIATKGIGKSSHANTDNAPVICVSGPLGAGNTGDIAGLKCRDLTADESRQCRRCAGF